MVTIKCGKRFNYNKLFYNPENGIVADSKGEVIRQLNAGMAEIEVWDALNGGKDKK